MPTDMQRRVDKIVNDAALDRAAKIAKLRQLEADALARQRTSTEGMEPHHPRDGDDLKSIETGLRALGEDAVDQGPASF